MKPVTHKHQCSEFWTFNYRIAKGLVFVERDNEWIRSTVKANELITLEEHAILALRANDKPKQEFKVSGSLIAEDSKKEISVSFSTLEEAVSAGFKKFNIKQCLLGKNKTHKGFVWREAA